MIENWAEYRFFERRLQSYVENVKLEKRLKKALIYIISAGGKRIRPIIVLVSGKMCGADYDELMNLALAVEFVHTASLIHDDIIDLAEKRRSKTALHIKYDLPLALILGDWLISKSVELTSVYGEEIVRENSKVGMLMCEGEILDYYSSNHEFGEDEYFECIDKKTAELLAYSAKTACRIACNNDEMAERLYDYGKNLGLAYQIVDDLLEYAKAIEDKSSGKTSKTILHIYEEKLGREGAISEAIKLVFQLSEKSRKSLDYFEDSEEKWKLNYILDYMTRSQLQRLGPPLQLSE